MAHERRDSLEGALDQLSDLLFTEQTLASTLQRIAQLAVLAIPGADLAGVALMEDDSVYTGGASAELVEEIDSFQYASDEGPCLEAIATESVVSVESTDLETRWPRFARKTFDKGVGSVLSSPLLAHGRVIGSLNLYAFDERSFVELDRSIIVDFARKAATLIANAELLYFSQQNAIRLRDSLDDCDLHGKATGILMERLQVTGKEADISLRRDSNTQGKSLYVLAADIVSSIPRG